MIESGQRVRATHRSSGRVVEGTVLGWVMVGSALHQLRIDTGDGRTKWIYDPFWWDVEVEAA